MAGLIGLHLSYITGARKCERMPNTFAPRAFSDVVKDRTDRLRLRWDGRDEEIHEWHAMVDLLSDEATEEFIDNYHDVSDVPNVVSGFTERGKAPPEDGR